MAEWLNLDLANYAGEGIYDMPKLDAVHECDAQMWMAFDHCLSTRRVASKKLKTGVYFFLNDSRFERCWSRPDRYGEMLNSYNCVLAPDFSMYLCFPKAVQIWNQYRKHWLARYWQDMGLTVIPTISWSDEESFNWCFDGEPKHSIVAVSNIGCVKGKESRDAFMRGYEEMLKRLEPELVLVFAHKILDYPGNVKHIQINWMRSQEDAV